MLTKWIFVAISTASLVAISILTLQILYIEQNNTAGVLTLKFNLTGAVLDQLSLPSPAHQKKDLFQNIQSAANSALDVAATRVSDAASHVQTALSSVATFVQAIEEHVPHNCSLGTGQFCVGYKLDVRCSDLPLNLSDLIPDIVQDLPDPLEMTIRERVGALAPLVVSLAKFYVLYTPKILLPTLILMVIPTAFSAWLVFASLSSKAIALRKEKIRVIMLALLMIGFICCIPFVMLVFITRTLIDKANGLPSWVEAEKGEVYGLSSGALTCALVAVLAAGVSAINVL